MAYLELRLHVKTIFLFLLQVLSRKPIFAYLRSKSKSQNELERIEYDRQSRKN